MTSDTDRYHHGDLPNALRRAAAEVIAERGVGGFSLREVARRAGVSHTAPAHHFGDMRGLLTSLAAEGFDTLRQATSAAAEAHTDPVDQLSAIGEAYVELARTHPAHCAVMFRPDLLVQDDEQLQTCGIGAYEVLERIVRRVIDDRGSDVPLRDGTWLCWSTMQGLVELQPKFDMIAEIHGEPSASTPELVRRFTTIIVRGLSPQ